MTRLLVIVAHPDLAHSRINRAWADALTASGAVDVHILSENLARGSLDVLVSRRCSPDTIGSFCSTRSAGTAHRASCTTWLDAILERGWAYAPGGHALEGKQLRIAAYFLREPRAGRVAASACGVNGVISSCR